MRLLERYVLSELLKVFVLLVSVMTVLLVFVGLFQQASENALGPLQMVQIMPYVVPSLLPFTVPATVLLAVCVVYGRLAGDLEITAAKAAGVNVLSLLMPAFLLGTVLAIGSFILSDSVIPWATNNIRLVLTQAMEQIFLDALATRHQVNDQKRGVSITVERVDGKRLIRPIFKYAPDGKHPYTAVAEEATIQFDAERRKIVVRVKNATVLLADGAARLSDEPIEFPLEPETAKPNARSLSVLGIMEMREEMKVEVALMELQRDWQSSMVMVLGDFDDYGNTTFKSHQKQIKSGRSQLRKFHTEQHNRFAMSASCLFFTVLGAPFSIMQARRQFLTCFIMCFVPILLVYYPVVMLMMNLSKAGSVSPVWSVWVGNAVVLAAGLHFLRRVIRH